MKKNRQAKIILHGTGTGDITNDDVEKRAREIAVIRGRDADLVSEEDREEAYAELQGALLPETSVTDGESRGGITRDPSEPISDSGHQVLSRDQSGEDEDETQERLATEGVEEAQHDQMLAAREREHREDRDRG